MIERPSSLNDGPFRGGLLPGVIHFQPKTPRQHNQKSLTRELLPNIEKKEGIDSPLIGNA